LPIDTAAYVAGASNCQVTVPCRPRRRYQSDNHELLDLLANDAWSKLTDAKEVVGMVGPWPRRA